MEPISGSNSRRYNVQWSATEISLSPSTLFNSSSRGFYKYEKFKINFGISTCLAKAWHHQGNIQARTSSLLKNVYSSQKEGRLQTHNRPLCSKQEALCSKIQNGDYCQDHKRHLRGPLGSIDRFRGCLSPCTHGGGTPQISSLCTGETHFCIPGAPIWTLHSPMGVYKSHQADKSPVKEKRNTSFIFPRRFPNSGPVKSTDRKTCSGNNFLASETQFFNKLEKVSLGTSKSVRILGNYSGSQSLTDVSPDGQNEKDLGNLSSHTSQILSDPKGSGKNNRLSKFCSKLHSSGTIISSSYNKMDELSHFSSESRCAYPSGQGSSGDPDSLGRPVLSSDSSKDACPDSCNGDYDRCFPSWLVWDPSTSLVSGRMGPRCSTPIHELEGAQSDSVFAALFSQENSRENNQNSLRQFHGSGLLEEAGISPIHAPVVSNEGHFGILSDLGYSAGSSPHQGSPQCPGRRGFQRSNYSNRMDLGRRHLRSTVSQFRQTPNRPLCHKSDPATSPLHVSVSGWDGCCDRCFEPRLEDMGVNLSFPSSPTAAKCLPETPGVSRLRIHDSPILANKSMVLQFIPESSSSFSFEGFLPLPEHGYGFSSLPECRPLQAKRLAVVEEDLINLGLSEEARGIFLKKHSVGSVRQYQSSWKLFLDFLALKKIDHSSLDLGTIVNFLAYQSNVKKREYKTVASYKNSLRDPLKRRFNLDIDDPLICDFMRGLFKTRPPRRAAPMPCWDLSDLLEYLRSEKFEPLDLVSHEFLFQKVGILLLLATGRRLGEIANFTKTISYEKSRVVFNWPDEYLAKNEKEAFTSSLPSISHLRQDDKNLCPVRAVEIFLKRRDEYDVRNKVERFWPISQKALSDTITKAIKVSIVDAGKVVPAKIGCHQLRKLAASFCFNHFKIKNKEVLLPLRMGSKSMSVLKKSYIRSIAKLKFACVFPLGTLNVTPDD